MIANLSNSIPDQTLGTKTATGGGVSLYNPTNTTGSGRLVS